MNNAVGRWLKVGVLLLVAVALAACAGATGAKGEPGPPGPPGTTTTTPPEPTETPEPAEGPTAVGTIDEVMVDVGATETVDVADNFSGENLDYSADTPDTDKATVTSSGSMISVTGVEDGTAIVTVTATDADGLSAMQTFDVTVGMGDVVDEGTDCSTLNVDDTCKVMAAAENTVKSGNTNLLTVTKKDGYYEVLAIAKGDTTVEVRNSNTNALVDTIMVHINNQAPTRTTKMPVLAQLDFDMAGEADYPDDKVMASPAKPLYKIQVSKTDTGALNLDDFFTDPDGDDVMFSAESSHPDRAIVVGYIEVADGTTQVLIDVLYNTGDEVTFTFSATDDDADDPMMSADDNSLLLRVELKPVLSWLYNVDQYDAPGSFNFHNPKDVDYRQSDPDNHNETDDTRNGWHQLVFTGNDAADAGFKFAQEITTADPAGAAHGNICGVGLADPVPANRLEEGTEDRSCYDVTSSDTSIVKIGLPGTGLMHADGDAGGGGTHTINYQVLDSGNVTITVTYKTWGSTDDGTPLTEDSKDLSVRVKVVDEP
jgi:hypothetical protein